jgi:hypothetical protein
VVNEDREISAYLTYTPAPSGSATINFDLTPDSNYELIQTTVAAANTTNGESIFATEIITVEDDMQARVPKTAGLSTYTWAADGTFTTDTNDTEVIDIVYFSPSTGQHSLLTLTIQADAVVAAPVMPATATSNPTEPSQVFGTFDASNTPNPAAVYTITGTDSGVLGINSATGAVTADSPTVYATKDTYIYTVTATNSQGADSTNVTTTIAELSLPEITGPAAPAAVELSSLSIDYTITNRNGEAPTLTGTDAGLFTINSAGGDNYTLDKTTNTGAAATVYNVTINIDNLIDTAVNLPITITCVEASTATGSSSIGIQIGIGI